jgi:hypothetical protein
MHVVLAVELLLAAPFALASSEVVTGSGAVSARAGIDVSISVPRVMQMRLLGHPAVVQVTAADIAAGKITVSGPSIDLQVNDRFGYAVRAEIVHAAFTSVRVAGLPSPIIATAQPAVANMPSMVGRPKPQPFAVQYELQLSSDAVPGQYAWPVALSLQQI